MRFKKLLLLAFAALTFVSLISTGCKKSNNTNNSATFSATIAGTVYTPATTSAWYSKDSSIYEVAGVTLKTGDTSGLYVAIAPPFTVNTAITDQHSVEIDHYKSSKAYLAGYGF